MIGKTISHYLITAIGAGGMRAIHRAGEIRCRI